MPVVMGTNLKKTKVYIDKYGNIKEGSIYDQAPTAPSANLGRVGDADRVEKEAEDNFKKKEK